MIEDDDVVVINADYVVTESTITSKLPVDKIEEWLRKQKKTGQLVHHISQGGIQKIGLIEKTKIPANKRDKIREILDL